MLSRKFKKNIQKNLIKKYKTIKIVLFNKKYKEPIAYYMFIMHKMFVKYIDIFCKKHSL